VAKEGFSFCLLWSNDWMPLRVHVDHIQPYLGCFLFLFFGRGHQFSNSKVGPNKNKKVPFH